MSLIRVSFSGTVENFFVRKDKSRALVIVTDEAAPPRKMMTVEPISVDLPPTVDVSKIGPGAKVLIDGYVHSSKRKEVDEESGEVTVPRNAFANLHLVATSVVSA